MVKYYARVMKQEKITGGNELEIKSFATINERDNWVTEYNIDKAPAVFEPETPPESYVLAQSFYPTQERRAELAEQERAAIAEKAAEANKR